MNKYHRVAAGLAMAAAMISAPAAHASIINTYNFTQSGWFDVVNPIPTVGNAEPNIILSGSFTGTVEPSGVIALADLTAFTETINAGTATFTQVLSQLSLFSFNTNGGASSLTIARNPVFEVNLCAGAAVFLSANCTRNFTLNYPAGIFGVYEGLGNPFFVSENLPVITLQSSVTTQPTGTAPEPASFFLAGGVLVMFGVIRRGSRPLDDSLHHARLAMQPERESLIHCLGARIPSASPTSIRPLSIRSSTRWCSAAVLLRLARIVASRR